jgi:hypothetical protein
MTAVLFTAPMASASRSCILSSTPVEQACKPACCANKTCCATANEHKSTPTQPLAKADSGQQLKATCFADVLPLSSHEVGAEQFRFQAAAPLANTPSRLALLCTLLI